MDKLEKARGNAYSIENREAHGAEGRKTEYIGSELRGNRIYDYYEDDQGDFWFRNRLFLPGGEAVEEEEYLFGSPQRKRREKRRRE